eukprot:TRINITY_DN15081_c0_g1_i1.p1 TRINITY_DN15081_c0_g1~~TRINITY_DN15081_c0_g1_i1.p1  ORF type:complete len:695 (+),score=200.76 TRINITY_DN15081_c0_g1_i1:104-2086(+)
MSADGEPSAKRRRTGPPVLLTVQLGDTNERLGMVLAREDLTVKVVDEGGPAHRAGVVAGMMLECVNGATVSTLQEVASKCKDHTEISLTVRIPEVRINKQSATEPLGFEVDDALNIVSVAPGGAAERAGVPMGLRVASINGKTVGTREAYDAAIRAAARSKEVMLLLSSKGTTLVDDPNKHSRRANEPRQGGGGALIPAPMSGRGAAAEGAPDGSHPWGNLNGRQWWMLLERAAARMVKDYGRADWLRDELGRSGCITDDKTGTWTDRAGHTGQLPESPRDPIDPDIWLRPSEVSAFRMMDDRLGARLSHNWELADRIRRDLVQMGFDMRDKDRQWIWHSRSGAMLAGPQPDTDDGSSSHGKGGKNDWGGKGWDVGMKGPGPGDWKGGKGWDDGKGGWWGDGKGPDMGKGFDHGKGSWDDGGKGWKGDWGPSAGKGPQGPPPLDPAWDWGKGDKGGKGGGEVDLSQLTPVQADLLHQRAAARAASKYQRADELRDELRKQGIELYDRQSGWVRVSDGLRGQQPTVPRHPGQSMAPQPQLPAPTAQDLHSSYGAADYSPAPAAYTGAPPPAHAAYGGPPRDAQSGYGRGTALDNFLAAVQQRFPSALPQATLTYYAAEDYASWASKPMADLILELQTQGIDSGLAPLLQNMARRHFESSTT